MIFKSFVNFLIKKDVALATNSLKSELMRKDVQIEELQDRVEELTNRKRNWLEKDHMKVWGAVLQVFDDAQGELNANQVFARIDRSKLKNKKPTIGTIRATIKYLVSRKEIKKGTKRGTFIIGNNPAELRLVDKK